MIREQEKEAAILKAEGDSTAALLLSEAMEKCGSGFIAIRKIDAAIHIMQTLRDSNNITFLSGNALNMVNVSGQMGGRWSISNSKWIPIEFTFNSYML